MLEEADIADREDSPRDVPARFVKLEERCALDFRAASREDPGIEIGGVDRLDGEPARSLSVAEPSSVSVVLLSRFEDEGVEPPELWLRSRRPNSVLYMTRSALMRQRPPCPYVYLRVWGLTRLENAISRAGMSRCMD